MAERARRIGVENLSERLPVANPRDELGRLAATFNELLGRLEASLTQQRQFMADASHELRTPVATARTAASVALQQAIATEHEYRSRSTSSSSRRPGSRASSTTCSRWRGPTPATIRCAATPMYLDEIVDEVVRAARVLADPKDVSIEARHGALRGVHRR